MVLQVVVTYFLKKIWQARKQSELKRAEIIM